MAESNSSAYIDYETFLQPSFSPYTHANALVLQTNNPSDSPLDLATPLSRALFDAQEIDTHIDAVTTQHARGLVAHTQRRAEASTHVLDAVEAQVQTLQDSYTRLQREIGQRHEAAEQVRVAAARMLQTLRLGREVQRVVQLGRQLEGQMEEGAKGSGSRAMVAAANSLLSLRQTLASGREDAKTGDSGLAKVQVVTTVRNELITPAERTLLNRAQQVVREFSMSSLLAGNAGAQSGQQTYAQAEETKSRASNALQALYLLSPAKTSTTVETFEPTLLISALQSYLQTALTSSLAALSRALATLPTLDRTLLEISARCQNIVALEALLENIRPPLHPLLQSSSSMSTHSAVALASGSDSASNFLQPLLRHLDTPSLPSYFWRSMASQLTSRVQDILNRGGVSARTLRSNRDRVRDAIRECVDRGSHLPNAAGRRESKVGNWEREAAVMVGSVVGPLQR